MAQSRRCVIIGAGILGASVAARLAAAGRCVTLLDQDEPGRAASRWSFPLSRWALALREVAIFRQF